MDASTLTAALAAACGLAAGFALGLRSRPPARVVAVLEAEASRARLEAAAGRDEAARARQEAVAGLERAAAAQAELAGARAELEAERRRAQERAEEAERGRERLRAEVELLGARLVEEKGRALLDRSREGVAALLDPLAERIRAFEAKVERTYDQENRDRASLLESLRRLQEAQASLQGEARELARALRGDSKAQGDWGELVLERVLEVAGLAAGREYALQLSRVDEDGGRKRPDAVVYLPGDRAVVVDAKCSLTAFVEAMSAASDEARAAALSAHAASLRAHVRSLAGKRYQEVLKQRTLDIVLLFVPSEAAFHAALAAEPSLYDDAFRQRVVLASPTTLLATLHLVRHVWRSEAQDVNARRIAEEAGRMLDKLAGFVAELDEVGARLDQAQKSFAAARARLATGPGNVLRKAAAIAELGARARPDKLAPLLAEAAAADGEEPHEGPAGAPVHDLAPLARAPGRLR
jgi:DNA recombination protein RmuC